MLSLLRFSPIVYTPRYVAAPRAMNPAVSGLSRSHETARPAAMRAVPNPRTFWGGWIRPIGRARWRVRFINGSMSRSTYEFATLEPVEARNPAITSDPRRPQSIAVPLVAT